MPRRNPGIAGKIKLAQTPALTPLAQKTADRQRTIEHRLSLSRPHAAFKLPPR